MSHHILYVEILTSALQNVAVFGNGVFEEGIKVKCGHMGGP